MSDEKKIKIELPDALEEPVKALAMPLATNVGTTIGDLWFLALGNVTHKAELRRAKYAIELEKYKKDLEKKLNDIPEDRRVEHNTQVVMNALVDSQSCVEDEVLRNMFANLIASACDSERAGKAHPAFSGIIKQLSHDDAMLLLAIGKEGSLPLVNFVFQLHDRKAINHASNIFIPDFSLYSVSTQSAAASCLQMLGLVELDYKHTLSDKLVYRAFEETPEFQRIKRSKYVFTLDSEEPCRVKKAKLQRGIITLTSFGRLFLEVCVSVDR